MTPASAPTVLRYRATTVAFALSIVAAASWVPVLAFTPWTMLAFPAAMFIPAIVALRLAFATRRRVKQGLEAPSPKGRLGLTFVLSAAHTLFGGLAALFLLLVGLWFLAFVKGVFVL
jgi:hypothetical protein